MSQTRITELDDGRVVLSKRNRAVSIGVARALLSRRWPGVEWQIVVGDHRTYAVRL